MELRPFLALALVQAACFSKPAFEGPTDASIDAGLDAAPVPACLVYAAWQPAQAFPPAVLSASDETSGWISEDRLAIMFWSNRNGSKIYRSARANISAEFSAPVALDLMSPATFGHFSLAADGLRIWFDDIDGDILTATRGTTAEPFGTPEPVIQIASLEIEHGVDVSADGTQMAFMRGNSINALKTVHLSNRPDANVDWPLPVMIADFGGGTGCCPTHTTDPDELIVELDGQLARMRRSRGSWGAPEVFRPGAGDPYLTRDGRTLVFTQMGASYDLAFMQRTCMNPVGP